MARLSAKEPPLDLPTLEAQSSQPGRPIASAMVFQSVTADLGEDSESRASWHAVDCAIEIGVESLAATTCYRKNRRIFDNCVSGPSREHFTRACCPAP